MNIAEKLKEWLARGGDPAKLEAVIGEQDAREKEAEALGIAFKADGGLSGADQPEAIQAPPPVDGEPMMEAEPEGDELDMIVELIGQALAPMNAKLDAIVQAVGGIATAEKMAAMHSGMSGMLDELKACVGGYQKQKDDESVAISQALQAAREQAAQLEARLKELEGDQPAALRQGYRASQDPATTTIPDRLKEAGPKADPLDPMVTAMKAAFQGR